MCQRSRRILNVHCILKNQPDWIGQIYGTSILHYQAECEVVAAIFERDLRQAFQVTIVFHCIPVFVTDCVCLLTCLRNVESLAATSLSNVFRLKLKHSLTGNSEIKVTPF